jgi:hypothetical protein
VNPSGTIVPVLIGGFFDGLTLNDFEIFQRFSENLAKTRTDNSKNPVIYLVLYLKQYVWKTHNDYIINQDFCLGLENRGFYLKSYLPNQDCGF